MTETSRVAAFSSEYGLGLLGLPGQAPLLSWSVESISPESRQVSAQVQASASADFANLLSESVISGSDSQFILAPGGNLESRETRYYRVRVQVAGGGADAHWTQWSESVVHEAGLIHAADYVGVAIGDVSAPTAPPALLRKEFTVAKPVSKARLYATAHGTFDLMINGQRVGNEVLAPGWTPYAERLHVVAHDVTFLLDQGANAWGVLLADGWYRGHFGFTNQTGNYGTQTKFLGQLEITYNDGSIDVIPTDSSWLTSTGGVRSASIYNGTDFDFNHAHKAWCKPGFNVSAWTPVTIHPLDVSVLEPRYAAPVRVIQEFATAISKHHGVTRVDVTQNISGWLKLKVRATAGSKLVVKHAEVLEPNGDLHTKALRFARATDTYIFAADGEYELEPKQTFHGFQYADAIVESGSVEILAATGVAISSDIASRSSIETSHPLLNKLVSNTYWSLRDNFVSIPTDCPQRDERLGWTGDAQAFAYAAHSLVDGHEFYKTWLRDLEIEQGKLGGKVPMIVPDILSPGMDENHPFFALNGEAGWSDAATVIPWSLYERFGDLQILRDQLSSMRSWVAHNTADHEGLLIGPRMQLGDWLDPDAPEGQPWAAKVSGQFMSNAYHAHSIRILSKTEALVGDAAESVRLEALFQELKSAIWAELAEAAATTPTGAATLLEFDLAPDSERARIAASLANGVRQSNGRISTGFLGTPIILDAMSRNGYAAEAFQMLLRQQMPSWLYPITKGATTIWERWNGILEDGSINAGGLEGGTEGSGEGMISFNHYAYGAVVDWIYRNVGGLVPTSPGYQTVSIAPLPHTHLTSCNTSMQTGYGKLELNWRVTDDAFHAELTVPFGIQATLNLPLLESSEVLVVNQQNQAPVNAAEALSHGSYKITVTNPAVIS